MVGAQSLTIPQLHSLARIGALMPKYIAQSRILVLSMGSLIGTNSKKDNSPTSTSLPTLQEGLLVLLRHFHLRARQIKYLLIILVQGFPCLTLRTSHPGFKCFLDLPVFCVSSAVGNTCFFAGVLVGFTEQQL